MTGFVEAYRRVLRNSRLTRLLAGEFISGIGDWLYLVAILVLLYERTQDPVLLGVVGAARVVPYIILSVPAGIAADRLDRRTILIVTDLARGGLMLGMAALVAVDADVAAIVGVAIAATCFSAFFGPALGAYLPSLVRDESDLGPANTVYATLSELTFVFGSAAGAVVVAALDLSVAFLLNAVSFGVVAAILWTLPSSTVSNRNDGADDDTGPANDGPPFHWRSLLRPLTAVVVMDGASSFVFGGVGVMTVIIAFDLLDAGDAGPGLLNAAMGVGGLLGSLLTGMLILRRRLAPPIVGGAIALGAGVAALGLSGSMALSMLAIAVAAAGALLTEVVYTTMLQRMAPDAVRGRVFGVAETIDVLAFAAGAFLIPALSSAFPLEVVLVFSGVAVIAVIGVSTLLLGDWATQVPPLDAARAVLGSVPAFAGLSPARLEAAQRRAVVEPMLRGQTVIRQGDDADRFYVIADGTVEVTQTPEPGAAALVLRAMGKGEAFGEIGLLSGIPRTATVTAVTDGTLLALDKEAFLELVADATDMAMPTYDPYLGRAPARTPDPGFRR